MFYTMLTDPTRVRIGDVIVIPASKAKALALKPSTMSKYNVSFGFTSRSDNRPDTFKRIFTDALEKGEDTAFTVVSVRSYYRNDERTDSLLAFFGNGAAKVVDTSAPSVRTATLSPMGMGCVSGTAAPSDVEMSVMTDVLGVSRVAKALGKLDDVDFFRPSVGCADRMIDQIIAARRKRSFSGIRNIPINEYHDADLTQRTVEQILSGLFRTDAPEITLSAAALELLNRKGARFLRPTEACKDAMADAVAACFSEKITAQWTLLSAEAAEAVKTAVSDVAAMPARTRSWKARAKAARKALASKVGGRRNRMDKEMKGLLK